MRKKLRLEYMNPEELRENPLNWRTHPKKQQERLKESLDNVGWAGCILYNERTKKIIDGHLRRKEAIERNEKVPVLIGSWTKKEERLILASFDPITSLAGVDANLLNNLLDDVKIDFPNIDLTDMFEDYDLIPDPEITQDEPPPPPVTPKSKPGEIYQLGHHRLMCGDSTDKATVSALMDGKKADMVFTDPPYGIDYSGGRTQIVREKPYGKIEGDADPDISAFIETIMKNNNGKDTYICTAPTNLKIVLDTAPDYEASIIWKKQAPGLGYQKIRRYCELILYYSSWEKKKNDPSEFDIWEINTDNSQDYQHGTQKPVMLPARAIQYSIRGGNLVLDLFGGSGTTLIACEQLNRICYMMELDPRYVDVIIKRWENLTGKKVELIK